MGTDNNISRSLIHSFNRFFSVRLLFLSHSLPLCLSLNFSGQRIVSVDFSCKTSHNNITSHYFRNLHSFSMNCCMDVWVRMFMCWTAPLYFTQYVLCFLSIFRVFSSLIWLVLFVIVVVISATLTYHIDHSVRTCYWLDINSNWMHTCATRSRIDWKA